MRVLGFLFGLCVFWLAQPAMAQDKSWLQIEAQPNLNTAMDRARAYAALFPDVEGYRLRNGWYGIALGPTTPEAAASRLLDLRRQNLIPADSYMADGASYAERFWPVGLDATTPFADPATSEPAAEALPALDSIQSGAIQPEVVDPAAAAALPPEPEQTVEEARAAEAALTGDARMLLQEALKWYGFYDGKLDGSFGKGSRASFAAWQGANGFEQTGILTTRQRDKLTGDYASDQAEFGFQAVTEAESGIAITLPLSLIQFDHYEPPFVHYADRNGSGLKVLLISEPGGNAALKGLYDILQTLEILPATGERVLEEGSFTIRGRNDKIETLAYAAAAGGNIKGYILSWNLTEAERMTRILPVVQSSFRSLGDQALDPGMVPLSEAVKRGLLAGLDVRHPKFSSSGFFVSPQGMVLTTLQAVENCGKIVVERSTEATISFSDPGLGIALLTPDTPLAPKAIAGFAVAGRKGSRVALSGYSYGDKLPAPVITPGVLEDDTGLNGEPNLTRLSLSALPGDIGGPVLDASGAVLGMLMPPDTTSGKQLPEGVAFALSAFAFGAILQAQGVAPAQGQTEALPPDAFAATARNMTVLISCWE
jgi:peptidoglycan hydrolase-like protein with peptidoglycan-binding domain